MRVEKRFLELAPDHVQETLKPSGKEPRWTMFVELYPDGIVYYDQIPDEALNPPKPVVEKESMSSRLRKFFGLGKKND